MTGRPRRCGWYDAVAVRYAVRVNGLDALALTKLDVLDGLPELQVCTSYRCRGATLTEMPGDVAQLAACEPVYETMPAGRRRPRACGVRRTCRARRSAYIARLEEITGVPAAIVSTGSAREDTIIREGSIAARWFAASDVATARLGVQARYCLLCVQKSSMRCGVGVGELDAGAVARRRRRLRQLELRPGDRAAEAHARNRRSASLTRTF